MTYNVSSGTLNSTIPLEGAGLNCNRGAGLQRAKVSGGLVELCFGELRLTSTAVCQ